METIDLDGMDRGEWLAKRRNSIGGSDVSAILYANNYKNALDVYLEKIGKAGGDFDNSMMEFGRRAEEMVAKWFSDETGLKARRFRQMFIDDEQPYLHANPDRQILASGEEDETGILECKTTSQYYVESWAYDVALPWYLQLQHYLMIKGYSYGYITWLIRDDGSLHWKRFEADEEVQQNIREACHMFWTEHVQKKVPPADTEDKQEIIDLISKPIAGKTAEIDDDDIWETYKNYVQARDRRLTAKKQEKIYKATLELYTGSAEKLLKDGELVATYGEYSRTSLDQSRLKAERPDIYKEYQSENTYRSFKPKMKNIP